MRASQFQFLNIKLIFIFQICYFLFFILLYYSAKKVINTPGMRARKNNTKGNTVVARKPTQTDQTA